MYRQLDAQKIVDTACLLQSRISERFSGSGLSRLAAEVSAAAQETLERSRWIRQPHLPLRIALYVLLAAILGLFLAWVASLEWPKVKQFGEFIQVLEAGLSAMFFISAFVIFLFTWESRIKRERALKAIHELRAMAHIVDMHQLTLQRHFVGRLPPAGAGSGDPAYNDGSWKPHGLQNVAVVLTGAIKRIPIIIYYYYYY